VAILHPTVFARSVATRQSSTGLSLRGAERRGNLLASLGLLHFVRNDGERSVTTWQSSIRLSLRGAQRRGNLLASLGLLHFVRNDGARSVATRQYSTQPSLRGAQRRGNLLASLAVMISLWQCGFFTEEPQRNEATLCLYII
jgi:hypothetical protein